MMKKKPQIKRCFCIVPDPTRGRWKKCKRCGGRIYKTFDTSKRRGL